MDQLNTNRLIIQIAKDFFIWSAAIGCFVQLFIWLRPEVCQHSIFGVESGVCRATFYFVAVYALLVPIFVVVLLKKVPLVRIPNPSTNLPKKAIAFAFLWLFVPVVCLTPFFYLSEKHPSGMPFRVQLIYDALTGSLLGLTLEGAFLSFAACIGVYLLLNTLRRSK